MRLSPKHKIEYLVPIVGLYAYERDNGNCFNQTAVDGDRLMLAALNLPIIGYGVGKLLIEYVDLCKTGLEALLK